MAKMEMHDPPHPGEIIRGLCLEPLGLTVTAGAKALGISRNALSEVLNGHTRVSPEMAIRLHKAFGSTVEHWMRLQMQFDLVQARKRAGDIKVDRVVAPAESRG